MNKNERTGDDNEGEQPRRRRGRRSSSSQRKRQRKGKNSSHSAHNLGRGNPPRRHGKGNGSGNQSHRDQVKNSFHRSTKNHSDPMHDIHSELPVSVETSAGGLILSGLAEAVRSDGSVDLSAIYVALIGRLDRRGRLLWSMPKGHIEPHESTVSTAEREVWEETGVAGKVIAELGTIDYWFVSEGVRIHKTVHHYLLRYEDGDLNDEDPEVTEVQWLPVHQLVERLAYADERRLAREAFDLLPELALSEAQAGRVTPR